MNGEATPGSDRQGSLTEGLADLLARPVAAADRHRAARHVLDWVGCAIAGHASPAGRAMAAWAAHAGAGPARAIGAARLDAGNAAFVNGAYGNVLEMDDIHRTSILHPGPVVVPAALAAAERAGADAGRLLDAIVRGYEAVIRVGRSFGPGHYRHWHNTSTGGPFGAAAATASLLRLDRRQTVWALGNAGTQATGPWQCRLEGSMAKQLHTARAATAGLAAADLAAFGFDGPVAILEGPLGFYAATCPDPDPDAVLADPESGWLIHETSFKPWPACRHAHPTIDAALKLHGQVSPDAIEAVVVRSYRDAVAVCDAPTPTTVLQGKFSLQHCAAAVLADGPPTLATFEPPSLAREDLARLRGRVRLEAAEPFAGAYPRHYGAGVTVHTTDGRILSAEARDAWGDPENPADDQVIEDKAMTLMGSAGLERGRAAAIVAAARGLADGAPVRGLTDLLP